MNFSRSSATVAAFALSTALTALLMEAPFAQAADPVPAAAKGATVPALKDPAEQKAWETIAARFTTPPAVKTDNSKETEVAVSGLKSDAKGGGTASIIVDKASGRVVAVTSNGAGFTDEEVAGFAAFPEVRNLTLWHNGNNNPGVAGFTGTGLAGLVKLPNLERLTLAGGGLDDAGMAAAAKLPKLKELRAWHSRFSDVGIAAFRGSATLESITIGPMWQNTLTDKTIESLASCPRMKKIGISETWLTWDGGLKHLAKLKGQLTDLDLGNCIVDPAEIEKLRKELPGTKITWKELGTGRDELQKSYVRAKAEKWIPKELIDKAAGPAKPN